MIYDLFITQVFTNWTNLHLNKREKSITDLQTDFSDGVLLCLLMEVLSGKQMKTKCKPGVTNRLQKVQNINISLQFIAEEGIKLVGCGSEGKFYHSLPTITSILSLTCFLYCVWFLQLSDIADGNLKLIMGMIWTLILRYQIQTGSLIKSGKVLYGVRCACWLDMRGLWWDVCLMWA